MNRTTFPTIFAIAMDYLPIQASSVPCERVFSSSARTDTKQRNRLDNFMMEALQILKFFLRNERASFTEGWRTQEGQMTEDSPEEDLLQMVLRYQDDGQQWDAIVRAIVESEAASD